VVIEGAPTYMFLCCNRLLDSEMIQLDAVLRSKSSLTTKPICQQTTDWFDIVWGCNRARQAPIRIRQCILNKIVLELRIFGRYVEYDF